MKNPIEIKELGLFLNEANKGTYANKDAPKATPSRLKSEDYHFEKGSLIYHDTYFGGRGFYRRRSCVPRPKTGIGNELSRLYFGR